MWTDSDRRSAVRVERDGEPAVIASVEEADGGRWICRAGEPFDILEQVRARRHADGLYRSRDEAKRAAETKLRALGIRLRDFAPPAMVCVSTRVRPELRARLAGQAEARGISLAAMLAEAIERGAP